MFSFLFLSGLVLAQDTVLSEVPEVLEDGESVTESVELELVPDEAAIRELEGAALYQVALELISQGRFGDGEIVLNRVISDFADTTFSPRAAIMMAEIENMADTLTAVLLTPVDTGPASGRTELTLGQGLILPAVMGVLVPGSTFQPDEPLMPVLMGFAGLGLGVAGSMYADDRLQVTEPQAMALLEGELLGLLNGMVLTSITQPRDYRANYQQILGGFVVGAGAGVAAGYYLEDMTSGDVAMVHHGALWGGWLSAMSLLMLETDTDVGTFQRMVFSADAGAILGGILSTRVDISRKRANIITLSGVAGTFVTGGLLTLGAFYANLQSNEVVGSSMVAGSLLGAGVGAWLTREDSGDASVASGTLIGLEDGDWLFGAPTPTIMPDSEGGLAFGLSLARGVF
tara:strand:+ start:146 stop:1348 length:1203 start_codon:yes stop_codon:yes gene_type:complete